MKRRRLPLRHYAVCAALFPLALFLTPLALIVGEAEKLRRMWSDYWERLRTDFRYPIYGGPADGGEWIGYARPEDDDLAEVAANGLIYRYAFESRLDGWTLQSVRPRTGGRVLQSMFGYGRIVLDGEAEHGAR